MKKSKKTRTNPSKTLLNAAEFFLKKYTEFLSEDYKNESKELELLYTDPQCLPSKINLSEKVNFSFDKHRIEYILKSCHFLSKYYAVGKSPLRITLTNVQEVELLEGLNLLNIKRLLEHIACTIFNISGSIRAKYKHLLGPHLLPGKRMSIWVA